MPQITFGSLNNDVTALNYVTIKGTSVNKIAMYEESPEKYGRGIKFKISGYGNTIKNEGIEIGATDGVDYNSYKDLI